MPFFRGTGEYVLDLHRAPPVVGSLRQAEVDFALRGPSACLSFIAAHYGRSHPLGFIATVLTYRLVDIDNAPIAVARHVVAARWEWNWVEAGKDAIRMARRCLAADEAQEPSDTPDMPLAESFWFFTSFAVACARSRADVAADVEEVLARAPSQCEGVYAARTMHGLSKLYAERGDVRASPTALKALVAEPTCADLYFWAAELLRRAERTDEATKLEREGRAVHRGVLQHGHGAERFVDAHFP